MRIDTQHYVPARHDSDALFAARQAARREAAQGATARARRLGLAYALRRADAPVAEHLWEVLIDGRTRLVRAATRIDVLTRYPGASAVVRARQEGDA
ncbi:MAG: hypothetical protein ABF271_12800 [Abyssibacter sp.]|uniref:hypothetical protein n=1 Tax=Abyssibacter sp. TaxID=2320200 RepID=UPI00321AC5EA